MKSGKNTTMQPNLLMFLIWLYLTACDAPTSAPPPPVASVGNPSINPFVKISEIPLPEGYYRITNEKNSFADWLRELPLKKDKTVYLYNGKKKANQSAQFAVVDISVGDKDLQQCADAVMRLRAEYLYQRQKWQEISFADNNGQVYGFSSGPNRTAFERYLEKVFSWCGTASLEKQLHAVGDPSRLLGGQVFIKGGYPGHAAIVVDVAINHLGQKIFLLANSYMPAQDIHVLVNPENEKISPWFSISNSKFLALPEWTFSFSQLRDW